MIGFSAISTELLVFIALVIIGLYLGIGLAFAQWTSLLITSNRPEEFDLDMRDYYILVIFWPLFALFIHTIRNMKKDMENMLEEGGFA